jgi:hypothetical protein
MKITKSRSLFILLTIAFLLESCKENYTQKSFFDTKGNYLGDSIFVNNRIMKIVFTDSSFEIDSIVFRRYNNTKHSLQSKNTFKKNKTIFENINYYENGNIAQYLFINDDNENDYYERLYSDDGIIRYTKGYPFFKGFIIDTVSPKGMDIKRGVTICYRIYYANPPDCETKIYIKYDDGAIYDVFKKSKVVDFLQTVYQDNDEIGIYKVNVFLELKEKNTDTTLKYNKDVIFRVIE